MREQIAHYRLVSQLGAGGMGVVYRADDERLGRPVAVKVLPSGVLANEEVRRRFRHEARVLCSLNHPNIATLYDFGEDDGVDYLVMELIAGTTLQQMLSSGPLPLPQVLSFGIQIARALAAAHEVGVVHRDLKPGNVIVTAEGHVKVLDFGLAKQIGVSAAAATAADVVVTGNVAPLGTLPYMAPEQLRGDAPDARLDIYAAGVVLYEMATGRMPFEQRGALLVDAILNQGPTPPSTHNVVLPRELDSIIVKALDKQPSRRYQSAREMIVDLERVAAPTGSVTPSWTRRASRALTVPIAGSVLLLAILLWAVFHKPAPKAAASAEIHSLAVLPLENLSGDPQQEYFADGMTDELTSELAQINALRVISRTSAMRYKGSKKSLPEIARELSVDAVIEGSVLRSGNQARITTQLIVAADDRHIWAKHYDGDVRDALAFQSQAAREIASEIRAKLDSSGTSNPAIGRTTNPEAFEAYMHGRYNLEKWTPETATAAVAFFKQAIALDPNYALAYVGLGECYLFGVPMVTGGEASRLASDAARKALQLNPSMGEAHGILGMVKAMNDWEFADADREMKLAVQLAPNYAPGHHGYSHFLMLTGRLDESLIEAKKMLEVDPLSSAANLHLGDHYIAAGQWDRSIAQEKKTIAMEPTYAMAHIQLGQAYVGKGMYADAVRELRRAVELSSSESYILPTLAAAYAGSGDRAAALKTAKQVESAKFDQESDHVYGVAMAYAALDKNRAFAELSELYKLHTLPEDLTFTPELGPLHSDARWHDLLCKYGLPQCSAH